MKSLTIAIPTFNRSKRLRRALEELLFEIESSRYKNFISVYVSNNGSLDDTAATIAEFDKRFQLKKIAFRANENKCNLGFDGNVLNCYANFESDYIWFLSDDDNIKSGAIDQIINDIELLGPEIIYYNFDQDPYTQENPYIEKNCFFETVNVETSSALEKIVRWPKLSSLVFRKNAMCRLNVSQSTGFAHVELALDIGLTVGRVYHSRAFIAFPDEDFLDHIDFVPYIGNNLDRSILYILGKTGRIEFYDLLRQPHVDPLVSSLGSLAAYYRGRFVLTEAIKQRLWATITLEVSLRRFRLVMDSAFLKGFAKLVYSLLYCFSYMISGKRITRLRVLGNSDGFGSNGH